MSHILVVDDDPGVLRMSRLILATAGYEVQVACNGLEALENVARSKPDVLVLDLSMPVMDGWTAFRELERFEQRPSVLILSAYEAEEACHGLGAEAWLSKPFEPDELVFRVTALKEASLPRAEQATA
jgi:DNA-binding response OmpR family regulator